MHAPGCGQAPPVHVIADQFLLSGVALSTPLEPAPTTPSPARAVVTRPTCACPTRMKAQSLRQANFALRSALAEQWEMGLETYCPATFSGNPAKSARVDRYLDAVEAEQIEAGVVVAKPVILSRHKLRQLSIHMAAEARDPAVTMVARFSLVQCRAWFLMSHQSTNRHTQIGSSKVTNMAYDTPARGRIFCGYNWGKCLRDGSEHLSCLQACPADPPLDAVAAITEYVALARTLGWDMSQGFLFSPIDASSGARLPGPGVPAPIAARFVAYLKRWELYDGETLRGTRGGGAVAALLADGEADEPAAVQERAGWSAASGDKMFQRYTAAACIATAAGAPLSAVTSAEYERLNAGPLRVGAARAALRL